MDFTMEQNKALIEHFPYLQPRSLWTDEIVPDYSYDYIRGQWELPDGWGKFYNQASIFRVLGQATESLAHVKNTRKFHNELEVDPVIVRIVITEAEELEV